MTKSRFVEDDLVKNGLRFRHDAYWYELDENNDLVVSATIWTLVEVVDITNPEVPIAALAE